jgi:hypothetical protein
VFIFLKRYPNGTTVAQLSQGSGPQGGPSRCEFKLRSSTRLWNAKLVGLLALEKALMKDVLSVGVVRINIRGRRDIVDGIDAPCNEEAPSQHHAACASLVPAGQLA